MEAIQTDIWVRLQKLRGHDCVWVCADDAHGTAIMLSAEAQGISPQQLIDHVNQQHQKDFAEFLIGYDNFYTTHSEENRHFSESMYKAMDANGHIKRRAIKQLFDPEKNLFWRIATSWAPVQSVKLRINMGITVKPADPPTALLS